MEQWISLREFGRSIGRSLPAVQKAIASGRVPASAVRRAGDRITGIERNAAARAWEENTDAIESERNGKLSLGGAATPPAGDPPKPAADNTFLLARTREAELRGSLLELEKHERMGDLLPRKVVHDTFSEIFATLKSTVFRIPDRKAQALASETDPARVHRLLTEELQTVFDEFSKRISDAAGMVDDDGMGRRGEGLLS